VSQSVTSAPRAGGRTSRSESKWFYIWTAVVLAVAVFAVVFGWHSQGGTTDPTTVPAGHQLGRTTVVIDTAILVLREGLECILILAAVTASLKGANRLYRRPIAVGGAVGFGAGIATWFAVVWFIGLFNTANEFTIQAATGIPAIIVLLVVMNWFFHKIYWTGWISHQNKRRRSLFGADAETNKRRMLFGLAMLGFATVYREAFEIVIFLQSLREIYGSGVVLEGVVIGLLFTSAIGVLTFALNVKLPYKKLLIITGVMLLAVLVVQVARRSTRCSSPAGSAGGTCRGWDSPPGWAPGSRCSTTGRRSSDSSWRSRSCSAPTSAPSTCGSGVRAGVVSRSHGSVTRSPSSPPTSRWRPSHAGRWLPPPAP
jgi:high-affinity iron transporter